MEACGFDAARAPQMHAVEFYTSHGALHLHYEQALTRPGERAGSWYAGGDAVYAAVKAAQHRFTQGLAAELVDHGIAVNAVGPSTAIRTPGASDLIPGDYPTEDVEYLAETVLAMCHLPAAQRSAPAWSRSACTSRGSRACRS